MAAAVESLGDHPVINSSLDAECTEVTYHGAVHLGIAVDSDKGLMVPVIRDAATLGIPDLIRSIASVADSVRAGTVRPDDLSGGTFTTTTASSKAPTPTPPATSPRCGNGWKRALAKQLCIKHRLNSNQPDDLHLSQSIWANARGETDQLLPLLSLVLRRDETEMAAQRCGRGPGADDEGERGDGAEPGGECGDRGDASDE